MTHTASSSVDGYKLKASNLMDAPALIGELKFLFLWPRFHDSIGPPKDILHPIGGTKPKTSATLKRIASNETLLADQARVFIGRTGEKVCGSWRTVEIPSFVIFDYLTFFKKLIFAVEENRRLSVVLFFFS